MTGDLASGSQFGPPPGVNGSDRFANGPATASGAAGDPWATNTKAAPALPELPSISQGTWPGQTNAAGGNAAPNVAGANPANSTTRAKPDSSEQPGTETRPWMTLVFVSLTLISSLVANFFLGWSYVEARLRYQTLVRKTADKFRLAAEAA